MLNTFATAKAKIMRWIIMLCGMLAAVCQAALPQVSQGSVSRIDVFPSSFVPARTVDIWLPPGFQPNARYAVLYMYDGQMLFDAKTSWNQQEWQVDEVAGRLQQQG